MSFPSSIDAPGGTAAQGTNLLTSPDHSLDHRTLGSAVIAIENKLGINSGSAALNQVLIGQGAGSSTWGSVWNNAQLGTPVITSGTIKNSIIGTPAITSGTINLAVLGTPTVTLGSDAQGDVYYRSSGGAVARLAPGTSGQFLQTQGAAANPIWANASGKTLQAIGTSYSTAGSTGGTAYVDSGVTGTITPISATSRVIVQVSMLILCDTANSGMKLQLLRGTSVIFSPGQNFGFPTANMRSPVSFAYMDSPAGTTALTYKMQYGLNVGSGTVYVQVDNTTSLMLLTEISP